MNAHHFLVALTTVLAVAAVTTVLRGAINLHSHVQAGAETFLEALVAQAHQGPALHVGDLLAVAGSKESVDAAKALLTGREDE